MATLCPSPVSTIPIPRPKLRMVEKPPQGGRPKSQRSSYSFNGVQGALGGPRRSLRPLPTPPDLRHHYEPSPPSQPSNPTRSKVRPLPPIPTSSIKIEAVAPPAISFPPSPPPSPPREHARNISSHHPSRLPSRTPSPPSSPPPYTPGSLAQAGVVDLGVTDDLLEKMKMNPDRHQELIMLASSLVRLVSLDYGGKELGYAPTPKDPAKFKPSAVLPKLVIKDRMGRTLEKEKAELEPFEILSPIDFLTHLAPNRRRTVVDMVYSLAEEDFDDMPGDGSGSDDDDSDSDDGYSEDESVRKMAEKITREFATYTGKAVTSPAVVKRLSKSWTREKNGVRVAEEDYENVLGFLRRL